MAMSATQIADLLKPAGPQVFAGKGKLCLSSYNLHELNSVIDENTISDDAEASFQVLHPQNAKVNVKRDAQFLLDITHRTSSLKIVPDVINDHFPVNISKFSNVKCLEISKLDITNVVGIQKLRPELQELICCHALNSVSDVIENCGGDNSHPYTWSELKMANFSRNKIVELDSSFEITPWLQTLNLSYNEIENVEALNSLPNLKHLNLSYNKLDCVPHFKGQLCSRLQILMIRNNFIEDLSGLYSLVNLVQLDLRNNCLLDHKCLTSIAHLGSLQWLNLQDNPCSYHPLHRVRTCNYLNKNTATSRFVLDNEPLSNSEKSLTGSIHPMTQITLSSSHRSSSVESNINTISDRPRRIRNVTIEDEVHGSNDNETSPIASLMASSQHLEIKKQVEELRQEYGEKWLQQGLVQDVLRLEGTNVPLSSTPYESALDTSEAFNSSSEIQSENIQFDTAVDKTTTNTTLEANEDEMESEPSDGEDIYEGGEECIFLASISGENEHVLIVLTKTHISERNSNTSKEKARWHVNTVISCEFVDDSSNVIRINFDTVRRDRKQRIYELENEEAANFLQSIRYRMKEQPNNNSKTVSYQCMKCSQNFPHARLNTVLESPSIACPKCESTLVIEVV